MNNWRTIESAPKDGTAILTYGKQFMAVAEWIPEYGDWCITDGCDIIKVTHWMPLPEPPPKRKALPPPDVVEAAVLFHDWNCDDGEEIKYSYAKHPWKRLEDDELSKIEHLQCAILAKWVLGEKS